ncbi:MAG: ECF transporter S component [Clostridiales bacterium]|nr:ECF transporter S component [Clostridiales bacterium]
MRFTAKKLAVMAVLVAVSVVLVYLVHFPLFPAAAYLEYDPADIPILIGAFLYGPVAGLILTAAASVIQAFTVSAQNHVYGLIMHILATGTLTTVSSLIYRRRKTRRAAVIGLLCGTAAMGLIMLPANHFLTPLFMGVPTGAVDALLLPAILPFNLIKAGANSLLTFLLYKSVSRRVPHGEN